MLVDGSGFASLRSGEHVVLVDKPPSRYPYSVTGQWDMPANEDFLDPLLGLTFAAAVTSRIALGTGVLLLPEHNPVRAAKQAATPDVLSKGRLTIGIGVRWLAEEFAALGVPFAGRGQRAAEYVAAMRALWSDDVASFCGEFTAFDSVRLKPPSRSAAGETRSSSVAIATPHSGVSRPSATAGMASTSLRPLRRSGSGSWLSYAAAAAAA
jgi:probable F420-dependent oxidoreductase